jgi:hypothetical protein
MTVHDADFKKKNVTKINSERVCHLPPSFPIKNSELKLVFDALFGGPLQPLDILKRC